MFRLRAPFVPTAVALFAVVALSVGCGGDNPYQATDRANDAPATVVVESPGIADNDFMPAENAGSCIGLLERPGCGSESRGGWRLYLTFAVLLSGMGFIGWRIARSIRARDAALNSTVSASSD